MVKSCVVCGKEMPKLAGNHKTCSSVCSTTLRKDTKIEQRLRKKAALHG